MTRIARTWTTMAALAVVAGMACLATSQETKSNNDSSTKQTNDQHRRRGFLGVMVDQVNPAVASHISDFEANGQGLIVEHIDSKSAAAKAGIKVHDILMTYEDQKLFAAEQLIRLVGSDKPGNSVTIGLIRQGKQQKVKVELGERPAEWDDMHDRDWLANASGHAWGHQGHHGQMHGENGQKHDGHGMHPAWNSFDSMTLKKLDKDRFHATISYLDKEGKIKKHDYEGTHEEIHKQIENDKDLLPNERNHLLRSLDAEGSDMPMFFGFGDGHLDF